MRDKIEQSPEQQPYRSLLGAALNLEYGPCSVAAAELAKSAKATVSARLHDTERSVSPVSRLISGHENGSKPQPVYEFQLEREEPDGQTYDGRPKFRSRYLNLSLVQNIDERVVVRPVEVKEKKRFGSTTKIVEKEVLEKQLGDIWLADRILAGAILMPIATFQDRNDGNCSYVQIGPEINDDSIFAVQSDEETKRLSLIDGFRKLLPREGQPTLTPQIEEYFSH
jgi:hypothetical protein